MVHQTHHLNYQAHLCSNTYKILKSEKKNTKEQMYFHDGESMKLIYMNCLSKNYYPQGQSNTDKNCGRLIIPLKCPRQGFFFFFFVLFCFVFVLFCFVFCVFLCFCFCFLFFCFCFCFCFLFFVFCFVLLCFIFQKRGNELIYPKTLTKQRTEDKDKHALAPNRNALTTLTHNSLHK